MSEPERPFKRLSPLTPLVRSSILVVAAVASTWDDLLRGDLGPLAWGFLVLLVGGGVYGAASWLRTKYWIEADELRVDTGVISRQSRRIRVDRLQGIDISQPFVARILGLAELKMDVAGGGSGEGSLAFLTLSEAQDLRATLLARRDAVRAGHEPVVDASGQLAPPPPERVLARLDLQTLLLSLLLSPEAVGFLVSAVAFALLFGWFGGLGGVAAALPVLAGFVLTQFRRLSAYYGFTVSETPAGLQVRRGLFERDAQTITLARVQGVVVSEPILWRRFGWARLDVALAGSASSSDADGAPSASTVMPVAPRAFVLHLARMMLSASGSPDPEVVELLAPPRRSRWAAPVRRRFLAAGVGEHLVVSREGLLTRRTHVVPHARVQSLRIQQGPWQRRLGLADVLVDSPPGPVQVRARHRDVVEARQLLDLENERARLSRAIGEPGQV
ncbi:MAG: PH domain-containing protein [Nocardioidaceae bacterium]